MLLSRLPCLSTLLLVGGFLPGVLGYEVWVHTKEAGARIYDCHITNHCESIRIAEPGFPIHVSCAHVDQNGETFLKNIADGRYVKEIDINPPSGLLWGNSYAYEQLLSRECRVGIELHGSKLDEYGRKEWRDETGFPGECLPADTLAEVGDAPIAVELDEVHAGYSPIAFCKFYRDPDCNDEIEGYRLTGFDGDGVSYKELPPEIGPQMKRFTCF